MGSTATALLLEGVVKRYGGRAVLDGVELSLGSGEVRGLIGANGSGKTTLLRAIVGLIGIDAGSVQVRGPIGSIIEAPAFYPYLSARENLELLATLDRAASVATADRISERLATVGLADRAEDRVSGFSTGMRQRLGLAAALLAEPELLVLDEPTSALDPDGVADTAALLRRVAEEDGVAVLVASHQLDLLERVADSVVRLADGRLVPAPGGRA